MGSLGVDAGRKRRPPARAPAVDARRRPWTPGAGPPPDAASHPAGCLARAGIWEAPLSAALAAAGAACDADLIAAAMNLLRLADEPGFRSGKYVLDPQGSSAVNGQSGH
ncbi:MAG TPA: hypothetical protein VMV07_17400 [Streptosporangiaceae bacterium]|nr:hypothetical protein [Streptosporangiaceae bacterium]